MVKLPADDKVLAAINDPSLSYLTTFPPDQPFKSLYAVYALHEYLGSRQPWSATAQTKKPDGDTSEHPGPRTSFLVRAMSLVVSAISDPQLATQCPSRELQIELGSALVGLFVSLLKGKQFLSRVLVFRFRSYKYVQTQTFLPQRLNPSNPPCWIAS